MKLTPDLGEKFARIALGHVAHQYPHKADHVVNRPDDIAHHRNFHPVFFGSFDWHSCVHGWWLLLRLRARFPELTAPIDAVADATFTPEKLAVELAYLDRPNSNGFERPYGWAWLLALHGEAAATRWGPLLDPLARAFAARFAAFLPKATYPIRTGSHANTAFASVLAHDWAAVHDPALAAQIAARVTDWYDGDRDAQAWEPDGDAFLSPVLCEALAMSRVLSPTEFTVWFDAFLPRAALSQPTALFTPAVPSDRSDGKIAHLDGLNLSRAWCWRQIATKLASSHPLFTVAQSTASAHIAASIDHVAGDYAGEHWLATFALLALDA